MAAQGEFDVAIVGAGPAGLSAALVLARCRRRVLICDSGRPRNWASRALNSFLTRDGIAPAEFRAMARAEVSRYPTVTLRDVEVVDAARVASGFALILATGERVHVPVLLLASGQVDVVPEIEGAIDYYGRGVYHCPVCDGWENRDAPWVAYGRDRAGCEFALALATWTDRLAWCAEGTPAIDGAARQRLQTHGIEVVEELIVRLEGDGERLQRVILTSGRALPCQAFFFTTEQAQRSGLPAKLGCQFNPDGTVCCDSHAATNVPGLYVAGNMRAGLQLAIFAAAEGAEAGFRIHEFLPSGRRRA